MQVTLYCFLGCALYGRMPRTKTWSASAVHLHRPMVCHSRAKAKVDHMHTMYQCMHTRVLQQAATPAVVCWHWQHPAARSHLSMPYWLVSSAIRLSSFTPDATRCLASSSTACQGLERNLPLQIAHSKTALSHRLNASRWHQSCCHACCAPCCARCKLGNGPKVEQSQVYTGVYGPCCMKMPGLVQQSKALTINM